MLTKIKELIASRKNGLWKIIMLFSVVLFLVALFFVFRYASVFFAPSDQIINSNNEIEADVSGPTNECLDCVRRKIDGVYVNPEKADLPLFIAMLDNHFDARPVYGLEKASLVYEAEVEGRFTRYMAVFSSDADVQELGPVRSARPYFVDWASEFDSLYVHVGGSPQALAEIISKKVFDLNEFYNEHSFWRTAKKIAPHNVLTSSELLNKYLERYDEVVSDFEPWLFKDDEPGTSTIDSEIIVNFKPQDFRISWSYDKDKNDYLRISDYDRGASEIRAKNIIIQYLPALVLDEKLRLGMEVLGSGEAIICLDGHCTDGYWEKESLQKRTRFFFNDNQEVKFNAGTSWIEVLRPDIEVKFNKQS